MLSMQNPLGPYGNLVASVIAVMIVAVYLATTAHLFGLEQTPSLDNLALLTVGVVFGTQVVQNGTQSKATSALAKAEAANARLDALNAPPANVATTTNNK